MATRDSSFAYSIDQAQRLFGKGLEVIGSRTGIETLFNYGKEIVAQQDKDIKEGNYQPEYTMGLREAYQQGGLSDAIGWVAEKTGENIATSGIALGGGLASALTAPFSVPAAALIGGATILGSGIVGTGEVAEEMEQKTGSYNDSVAIGAGTIIALLDRFGAGRVIPKDELLTITGKDLIKKLGEAGKIDAAREIGRRIGKSVAFEGATEGLQEGVVVGSTAVTGGEYTGEEIADRLLEGVVLGGTMGGGTTTAIEAFRQGPGIAGLIGDTMGPGGMLPPSQQLAMQTAARLYGPSFAKYRAKDVPAGTAEILMNEAASGGTQRTPEQKADDNLEITTDTDPNIDEDQTFFNKDLKGDSVGNPTVQKVADEELKEIEKKIETDRAAGINMTDSRIASRFKAAKNRERFADAEDPVVSPLRIKLIKLASDNKFGMKRPVKVSEVYDELRKQERRREGSVGFLGREQFRETIQDEVKYIPVEGKGKEFGQAVKAAPKIDGKPDYNSIPNLDEIAVKTTVPKKIKAIATVFDAPNEQGDLVIHNRGGEAFVSGLEEYLVRNQNETKTMEEIIYEFDQMRPTVKLQVRSAKNRQEGGPFRNFAITQGDILQDPTLATNLGNTEAQALETTQRIYESLGTVTGKPINIEVPNATGNRIDIQRNPDRDASQLGSGQAFEIDSISVVAVNPDQERLTAGSLTNSPTARTLQQTKMVSGNSREEILDSGRDGSELDLPHDYYSKGFGYSRAMIVRGADGKLYAVLEELQSDVTRTYENLLDFAKPEYAYGTPVEYGGVPELFSGAIDMALIGNDPYLTKNNIYGTTTFQDKRPIRTLSSTSGDFTGRDSISRYKLLTPSERNKIRVLDAMDQDMPEDDAPSQFKQDLARRRENYEKAKNKYELAQTDLTKIENQIENFKATRTAPMEISKIKNVTLDDLQNLRKTLPKDVMRYVKALSKQKEDRSVSGRQLPSERLNKVESMLESFLFTDQDYDYMAKNFREGLEQMDQFEGTDFGNDPRQTAMREFDGFQMAQNGEFDKPAPDRLAKIIAEQIQTSKIKTPMKVKPFASGNIRDVRQNLPLVYNKQGRLGKKAFNIQSDENASYLRQLGFPRETKSLQELVFGHMPLRSNIQYMAGDIFTDLGKRTSDVGEERRLNKKGMLWGYGKEEPEDTGRTGWSSLTESHFEDILSMNLRKKGYDDSQIRPVIGFIDATSRGEPDLESGEDFGFRGDISEADLTDALVKTFESSLERGMAEAVNEQALDVIRHELATHIANKFKPELAAIDFDTIINNNMDPDSMEPYTDSRRFPPYFMYSYSGIMRDIENLLPTKVKKEAEKELSRIIDRVADRIGFVPEDGNYAAYMQEVRRRTQTDIGEQVKQKYAKKLGIDNPDALKKKLLMGSILRSEKIKPIATGTTDVANQIAARQTLLQRLSQGLPGLPPLNYLEEQYRKIAERLVPQPYEDAEYADDYFDPPNPDASNYYKLFFTDSYKGFVAGDKARAERIQKEKEELEKSLPKLKKLMEDNEVGADDNTEILRRYKKLIEHAEQNAGKYNYKPSELTEAALRLKKHVLDDRKYVRAPHNATMAQTSRGLLQSLVHKLTDPRFEELYKEPIVGVVVPHRVDLWLPRANEDSSLRGSKATFGMGTYDSTLATVAKRFEDAGATVDRDRIFEVVNRDNTKRAQFNRPVQFVIDISPGSKGRKLAEGKFTFRAKGGYIDLRRKAS
mgnify:CR=1 FL=1